MNLRGSSTGLSSARQRRIIGPGEESLQGDMGLKEGERGQRTRERWAEENPERGQGVVSLSAACRPGAPSDVTL